MKILVIFTGGTIGSRVENGWISTDSSTAFELIEDFKKKWGDRAEFVCREPYFVLSENLSAKELNLLCKSVRAAEKEDFDGIIVTHGTDSLQFSAAALALTAGERLPILLVSANYPLNDPRSNGTENFEKAVDFIEKKMGKGVFVSYLNPRDGHSFHRGDRLAAFLEGDDSLYSIKKNEAIGKAHIDEDFEFCESPDLLCIGVMPGDRFSYSLEGVNGVILRPYHSGTVNTESTSFKAFCETAKEKGVPVFLVNAPSGVTYDSAKALKALGVTSLPDAPFAAVYMRLWIAVSLKESLDKVFSE